MEMYKGYGGKTPFSEIKLRKESSYHFSQSYNHSVNTRVTKRLDSCY